MIGQFKLYEERTRRNNKKSYVADLESLISYSPDVVREINGVDAPLFLHTGAYITLCSPEFAISGNLVLGYPDLLKNGVYVDALAVGMGTVLMQEQQGVKKMVQAISRAFRDSELRYSATKKELKALV